MMTTRQLRCCTYDKKRELISKFVQGLESFTFCDEKGRLHAAICSVCDSIARNDDWGEWVDIDYFQEQCKACNLEYHYLQDIYKKSLLQDYKANHVMLQSFVLSWRSCISEKDNAILVCKDCWNYMEKKEKKKKKYNQPPVESIANGYLIGKSTVVLSPLSYAEVALLAPVLAESNSWVFFGGCHKQIKGWHTLYQNREGLNVAHVRNLQEAGMNGNMMVVLCGPFTSKQKALTREKVQVRPQFVVDAAHWLKENNYHYRDTEIPHIDSIPLPKIIEDGVTTEEEGDANIENQIHITVLFPDSSLPETTNGGFKTQEHFRNFVLKHQDGKWDATLYAKPTGERLPDYISSNSVKAFPLQFPYGHSGLPDDLAVEELSKRRGGKKANGPR